MANGYITPAVRVFQELTTVPTAVDNTLPAHVAGGHAFLVRYGEADERELGRLGFYDPYDDHDFSWPHKPAGAVIDQAYAKLWMTNALLQYYSGSSATGAVINKVSGYNNRIHCDTLSFKANGADFPRSDDFNDRDVQLGDTVKVRGVDSDSNPVTVWTYVKDILAEVVPAEVDALSADVNNAPTTSAAANVSQISGPHNCLTIDAYPAPYDGRASGYINETYDILVTASSVDGDPTTATLRIISGSGTDDVAEVVPAAYGIAFDIGTRGLVVKMNTLATDSCSTSADADGVSDKDLVAGQRFRVVVTGPYTAPVLAGGGVYAGAATTVFVITVTKGGSFAEDPQVTVTTSTGVDVSGPTAITAIGNAYAVGTGGLTFSVSTGSGLRLGDKYYIAVTGTTPGAYTTLVLGHGIAPAVLTSADLELTLFIRKPTLEVMENRTGFAPQTNFAVSETLFTVKAGITVYDASWTASGVPLPLDVVSEESQNFGLAYVEYRAWVADWVNRIDTVTVADLDDKISGPIHPDNPLKYAADKALTNSGGTPVAFSAVADPNVVDDWAAMLERLVGRGGVYGMAPLTHNAEVLDLYTAHINAMSSENANLWRVGWYSLQGLPQIPLVAAGSAVPGHLAASTSDGKVCLCVVEDDPLTAGTQYTIVRCTSANGQFLTLGVRAGDVVRLSYSADGFGAETYATYVIDEVESEDQLRLASALLSPIAVAAKTEIWRTLTATEEATAIGAEAGAFASRRLLAVWPDTVESGGSIVDGVYLCAALAGLASSVLPHQGLTHYPVQGFTSVPRSLGKFNRDQLDIMSAAGAWVVEQDLTGQTTSLGEIYTRDAITSHGFTDQTQRQESITRNVDSISYQICALFRPFIGIVNVTDGTQSRLQLELDTFITSLQAQNTTVDLGGQLLAGTTGVVAKSLLARDRFVVTIAAVVPYALDNIDVHIQF